MRSTGFDESQKQPRIHRSLQGLRLFIKAHSRFLASRAEVEHDLQCSRRVKRLLRGIRSENLSPLMEESAPTMRAKKRSRRMKALESAAVARSHLPFRRTERSRLIAFVCI